MIPNPGNKNRVTYYRLVWCAKLCLEPEHKRLRGKEDETAHGLIFRQGEKT
jgi:hypothetical protein